MKVTRKQHALENAKIAVEMYADGKPLVYLARMFSGSERGRRAI